MSVSAGTVARIIFFLLLVAFSILFCIASRTRSQKTMPPIGWKQLIPGANLFRGQGLCPVEAYSEFMPPPRFGWKPYASESPDPQLFDAEDPWGWHVTEYEEHNELQPGLAQV